MAIQHRRGADVDFKPDRMKAGELALTTDGTRKMYAAFAPGDVKEVAFKEDIPEGGGGGSFEQVQSDYAQTDSTQPDYIKNKLFGKEVTYSDTLTWDGNTEGLESVEISNIGVTAYKISDKVITLNDLQDGLSVVTINGDISLSYSDITNDEYFDGNGFGNFDILYIVPTDNYITTGLGVEFPSKGLYVAMQDGIALVSSLTIPNYQFETKTVKKLQPEYMEPFEVTEVGGDTLTWDGDTSGLESFDGAGDGSLIYYKISDATPTLEETSNGVSMRIYIPSINSYFPSEFSFENMEGMENVLMYVAGSSPAIIVFLEDNVDLGGLIIPNKGIYVQNEIEVDTGITGYIAELTIPNYTGFTTTEKKLKGEYLPGCTVTRFSVNYDEVMAAMSGAGVPYIYYYGSDVTLVENRVSIADLIEALKKGSVQLWFSVEDDGFSMEGMYTPMTYMNTGLPMINVMVAPNVGIGFYTAEYTP